MKKSFVFALLILLTGSVVYAQSDMGAGMFSLEGAVGFQWNRMKEGEAWSGGPAFTASVRFFVPGEGIALGFSIGVVYTFLTEMEYIVPDDSGGTQGIPPGGKITIKRDDADSLYNLSIFAGLCLNAAATRNFAVVSDFGLAFSFDTAKWEKVLINTPANRKTLYSELSTNYLGLFARPGLQLRLSLVTFEAGVNVGYYFLKWNTVKSYIADPQNKNNKEIIEDESGNFDMVNFIKIGAPYISIGFKF